MATKTISNQGGSNSGISEVKYQKAIKEISKLISLNTELKNKFDTLQVKYNQLQEDFQKLQHNSNSQSLQNLSASDLGNKIQELQQFSNVMSTDFNQATLDNGDKDKIANLEEINKQKQYLIKNLQIELDQKDKYIQDLTKKNTLLSTANTSLEQRIRKLTAKSDEKQKQNLRLKKQLEKSEGLMVKLTNDYEGLVSNDKTSASTNSILIGLPNSQSLEKSLSHFYTEKLKKSESSNAKLKKKCFENNEKFKAEIQKLKKQKEGLNKKITQLSEFVQKQQSFIVKFMKSQKQEQVK